MRYLNNWITQLTGNLLPGGDTLPVSSSALERLVAGEYRLTLVNSTNPVEQTAWEIIGVTVTSSGITLARGQEGTAAQPWPTGTVIYCAVTAGGMNQLVSQIEDLLARVEALEFGGGGTTPTPDGVLVDQAGNLLVDGQNNQLVRG